jgi:hypothetical protein
MLTNDHIYRLEEAQRIVESRIAPKPAAARRHGRLRLRLRGPRAAQNHG